MNRPIRDLLRAAGIATLLAACGSDEAADTESGGSANDVRQDGTITAILDGEPHTWYVTSRRHNGELFSQSDWHDFGTGASVSLWGHASPDSVMGSQGALSIGFIALTRGDTVSINDPELSYMGGGLTDAHTSGNGGTASIRIDSFAVDGDELSLSGSFSGTLPYHRSGGEQKDTVQLEDGRIEAVIRNRMN